MNKWDSDNLKFIMSLSAKDFDAWYESLDSDDVEYALELIKQARAEVGVQIANVFDEVPSLKEARKILAKYTISKKVTVK